jgi:hypothetical protein
MWDINNRTVLKYAFWNVFYFLELKKASGKEST